MITIMPQMLMSSIQSNAPGLNLSKQVMSQNQEMITLCAILMPDNLLFSEVSLKDQEPTRRTFAIKTVTLSSGNRLHRRVQLLHA